MVDQILDLVKNKDTNLIYAWDTFSTVSLNPRRKKPSEQTNVLGHKSKV